MSHLKKSKCSVNGCARPQKAVGNRSEGKVPVYDNDGYLVRKVWKPAKTYYSKYCDLHRYAYNRPK